jgi:hydroxyethylthiazole kinase-like uncharacterized protein yjeF
VIPLLHRTASRDIDADAVERLGIPSIVLMENAGHGAWQCIKQRFARCLSRVVLVGGPGQNGGDAWVVARHMLLAGHQPRCVLIGERDKVTGDAQVNLVALSRLGVVVEQPASADALRELLAGATLLVDGLFGTGLDRPIAGRFAEAVDAFNASPAPRVALDIPSGIDADSGAVLGTAVRAALTLSFAAHKRGLHQHPGAGHAGEVVCVAIGVPGPSTSEYALLEGSDVAGWLPPRAADTHKGQGGHVLIVAGAPGRTGAALLSGLGALRGGAGLVTLCPRAGARPALDAKVIELMTADLPPQLDAALLAVHEELRSKHAAVVGPGLGVDADGLELARRLGMAVRRPAVLDADALTAFGGRVSELRKAAAVRVLTPHPGEAARLLGTSVDAVQTDRYAAAVQLAADSGSVVVLKGARTLIATPHATVRVCPLDVPALAVAGTGDVLSGVVAALLSQLPAFEAACAAVYLHALAGRIAARSDRGLVAREVADALPLALEQCRADSVAASALPR